MFRNYHRDYVNGSHSFSAKKWVYKRPNVEELQYLPPCYLLQFRFLCTRYIQLTACSSLQIQLVLNDVDLRYCSHLLFEVTSCLHKDTPRLYSNRAVRVSLISRYGASRKRPERKVIVDSIHRTLCSVLFVSTSCKLK
jgi:hypothetical protein